MSVCGERWQSLLLPLVSPARQDFTGVRHDGTKQLAIMEKQVGFSEQQRVAAIGEAAAARESLVVLKAKLSEAEKTLRSQNAALDEFIKQKSTPPVDPVIAELKAIGRFETSKAYPIVGLKYSLIADMIPRPNPRLGYLEDRCKVQITNNSSKKQLSKTLLIGSPQEFVIEGRSYSAMLLGVPAIPHGEGPYLSATYFCELVWASSS